MHAFMSVQTCLSGRHVTCSILDLQRCLVRQSPPACVSRSDASTSHRSALRQSCALRAVLCSDKAAASSMLLTIEPPAGHGHWAGRSLEL